jgi:hypothetical protein
MTGAALGVCVLCAAAAIGCATEPPGASRDGGDPTSKRNPAATRVAAGQEIVVTEDDGSLPSGCRPAEVARLLDELFDALNRGDEQAAAALVLDREMLARLTRAAAAAGHPLRLRAVIVGFANGLGQIEFLAAERLLGKGAVDCETRRVVAIGLGAEHERMAPLCGGRPPDGTALACARHWG